MSSKDKTFIEFKCKRCGECCKTEYILPEITNEEWIPIINFLKEKCNGILIIKCNCGCNEVSKFKIKNINDFFNDILPYSELFWALDYGQCPFIKKGKKGLYSCEIYDIRPKVCKVFRCDLKKDEYIEYLQQLKKEKTYYSPK